MGKPLISIRGKLVNGEIIIYDEIPDINSCDVVITFLPEGLFTETPPLVSVRKRDTLLKEYEIGPRELKILEYLVEGMRNEQIAEILEIGHGTTRNYVHWIMKKLGTHNRTETVVKALDLGLVQKKG